MFYYTVCKVQNNSNGKCTVYVEPTERHGIIQAKMHCARRKLTVTKSVIGV